MRGGEIMTATADLFTSIHKGIRSMIYDLGGRLQRTDFSDRAATTAVLADLEHEFTNAVTTTCLLCLLHSHAGTEETDVFPSMQAIDPALIRMLIDEHQEITRRLVLLTRTAHEVAALDAPDQRIAAGARINREANEFFAYYLGHMNKEEVTIVPAMKEHFTDEQMGAMQGKIIVTMSREKLTGYLRWMLPSLTVAELSGLLSGAKRGFPPELFQFALGIGAANVDPARWAVVRERVGF
jgi:hypothetical protein